MLCMGRWIEREPGLVALLARANGTCQGFEPVGVGEIYAFSNKFYLTRLIFIHTLWQVSSDVSKDEERQRERTVETKWKKKILERFEKMRKENTRKVDVK